MKLANKNPYTLFTVMLIGWPRAQAGNRLTACLRQKPVGAKSQWRLNARDQLAKTECSCGECVWTRPETSY